MKLLAVDSNSIINRAYYGVRPLTTRDGQFTNAIYGFLSILQKLLGEVQPDALAFAFDLREPTFRHRLYDGYKATRKGMPPELAQQMEPTKEILRLMGYRIVTCAGYEADDILGTLGQLCRDAGDECVIATGDRDSFQLVGDGVTVRLASTRAGQPNAEMIDAAAIEARYGVTPRQMIEVKALMGDASDNIPGVAGVGEKTALALIARFGTLAGVYEHIDDPAIKPGVRAKLLADREKAEMSRTLAEICCTVPLGLTLDELIPAPRDNDALYRLLERLELQQTIKRLGLTAPAAAPTVPDDAAAAPQRTAACTYNDPAAFLRVLGSDALFADIIGERDNPSAAVVLGDDMAVIDTALPDFAALLDRLAERNAVLTLFNTKDWYHRTFARGGSPELCAFDPALAGYLLVPTSSDYSARALSMGRDIAPLDLALPEGLPTELAEAAREVALYPALCEALRHDIAANDMSSLLGDIEAPLSRVLADMENAGFLLDADGLRAFGEELDGDLADVRGRIAFLAGGEFNFNSPKQLGEVLFERLGLPAGKKTSRGYSTDADTLEKLRGKHPIIEEILTYRKLAKLKSTYVDSLLDKIGPDRLVHTIFKQTETRTGRISSAEPNLQNIPVRTPRGSRLREFFTAEPGCVLVDADYSQIELRLLAHISGDTAMTDAFLHGADIHTRTAAQVFDMPEEFVTPQMRSAAKAVNFGLVYGIGAYSLSQDIGVSVAEAKKYIDAYFATFSGVARYMQSVVDNAKRDGYVTTLFHRRRALPELTAQNHATRAFGERVARNTPIQGTAADIIKLAMVRVYDRLAREKLPAKLILQVHDELIVQCRSDCAGRVAALVREEMENVVHLSVPLIAEAKCGANWLEAKG